MSRQQLAVRLVSTAIIIAIITIYRDHDRLTTAVWVLLGALVLMSALGVFLDRYEVALKSGTGSFRERYEVRRRPSS